MKPIVHSRHAGRRVRIGALLLGGLLSSAAANAEPLCRHPGDYSRAEALYNPGATAAGNRRRGEVAGRGD